MFGYRVLGFGSGGGSAPIEIDYLVVAGGGAGAPTQGGGGGAGGYRTSFPGGTKLEMATGEEVSITVGTGGSPGPRGGSSSLPLFTTIESTGGAQGNNDPSGVQGGSGGGAPPNGPSGGAN